MRKAHEDGRDPWLALLDHRNTPTERMSSSPAQRLMSRRTRTLLPARETLLKPKLAESVQEERNKIKRKQALCYNRNAKDLPPLERGDIVRLEPLRNAKEQWKKATVQEEVNVRSYSVLTEDCSILRRNRRHLKATKEQPIQPQTDQMQEKSNTETSSHSSPQKPSAPQTPMKLAAAELAPTSLPTGAKQTRSGRVVKAPLYLKDCAC